MKLPSWLMVALWLLAGSMLSAAEKDDAPGYLSRIIGGAKNLLPSTSKASPGNALPQNRPPVRRGKGGAAAAQRGGEDRGAEARGAVEPATWNSPGPAATNRSKAAKSPRALMPQAARMPAAQAGARVPRTVSQYMAQERP